MCARPPVHALIRRPHGWCALQFTSKQLVRASRKCEKEEKDEKLKIKKAIEKGGRRARLAPNGGGSAASRMQSRW